ncbi:type II toxin-antitoxin system VapC family toxin [Paracoccus shandongensis]|uniref:type II toxin-antitoxin system VapC family toxin n=1 Tax=Paracoccus shandongensis TaxID=2816048 RepID=UPI001A8D4836|nr:type II toxin-antitoxin system VapC family toxin [Paracoccus shandongensis]
MFLDASAVVAVLLNEPEAIGLMKAMEVARGPLRFSPVVRIEATLALVRTRVQARGKGPATAEDFAQAGELVDGFFAAVDAQDMHITTGMGKAAIEALSIYGKVVGHPAQLNLGDALSYACAKAYHVPLLYKGADFPQTDLA